MTADQDPYPAEYPVHFAVEYPDRPLNRLTSFFRIFMIIPISIVLVAISGGTSQSTAGHHSTMIHGGVATGGLLALGPLLMILFRRKYRKHSRPRYA
jgi:hypothetical protein